MKRETMVWLAMGALLVAFFWYRKRKAATTIPSGIGSTVGTTIAGASAAPPASTLPLTMNTGIIGPGVSTLGSSAAGPVSVTVGLGSSSPPGLPMPIQLKNWFGGNGTPILSPRQGGTVAL